MREPVGAFGYINGKIYLGSNHLEIATEAFANGDISYTDLPKPQHNGPIAFGWLWDEGGVLEAEFYSDTQSQVPLTDDELEVVFQKLKKLYPNLTEISFGPDEETLQEMKQHFDHKDFD